MWHMCVLSININMDESALWSWEAFLSSILPRVTLYFVLFLLNPPKAQDFQREISDSLMAPLLWPRSCLWLPADLCFSMGLLGRKRTPVLGAPEWLCSFQIRRHQHEDQNRHCNPAPVTRILSSQFYI